jgi:O-antigen ligase
MTIIFWIFTLLIMLAPLPFGMVYEMSQSIFTFLIFLMAIILCIYQAANRSISVVSVKHVAWESVAFFMVIGWAIVQILPITPAELHHPLWEEAERTLDLRGNGMISLAPGAGFFSLMRLSTYAGVFWIAMQLGRDRIQAKNFFDFFVLAGVLYAVYGIVMNFEGFQKILWAHKESGFVTGTLVNRNNFATYIGLALLCSVGAYLFRFREITHGLTGRDRIVFFLQTAFVKGMLRLSSIIILLGSLLMSLSRAGITFSLLSLGILFLLYLSLRSKHRVLYGPMTAILILALIIVISFNGDKFFQRISETTLKHDFRLKAYEQIWQAIQSAPIMGFGLGSFEQAFPFYADIETSQLTRAHNDWLEIIFELGWPGALLWFSLLTGLVLRCFWGVFRRERDHLYPLVGCCAGLLVGLHSFVDFSLQIPAIAASFAALLGIGVAQSYSSREFM